MLSLKCLSKLNTWEWSNGGIELRFSSQATYSRLVALELVLFFHRTQDAGHNTNTPIGRSNFIGFIKLSPATVHTVH